jgi:hypothetical protein
VKALDRVVAVVTLVGGIGWAFYVLVFGSDAGLPVPALIALTWGCIALFGLWVIRCVVHILAISRKDGPRSRWWLLAEPAALFACFALVWTGGAFRLRFALSRPALERYVRSAGEEKVDGRFATRKRVGLFWLRESEVLPGDVVRMITTPCMFDDCGVVYSPAGEPPRIGEDSYRALGGPWYHWWRSW